MEPSVSESALSGMSALTHGSSGASDQEDAELYFEDTDDVNRQHLALEDGDRLLLE